MSNRKYTGRKAVVIGGTHGMGLAMVKALLAGGAEVLLTGRSERNLDAARQELTAHTGTAATAHVVRSDVASLAEIDTLAARVAETFGRFDFLFVNVGFAVIEPFDRVTEETYDRTFSVNTKGPFFTVQRLAPLLSDGGAIVFTTSIADTTGTPGMLTYSAAKAAVRSFTQVLAAELLPRRIRVNAVSPGYIKTPTMGIVDATEAERAAFEAEGNEITPMKRNGTVEEVATAALFLAADATFTTGAEFPVDGGLAQGLTPPSG